MPWVNGEDIYRVTLGVLEVMDHQIPQFLAWNLEQSATVMIRVLKDATSYGPVRDAYKLVGSTTHPKRLSEWDSTTAVVEIINTHPLFGTMLSGSATKNVDKPGPAYRIDPRDPSGFLFLHGVSSAGGGASSRKTTFAPTHLYSALVGTKSGGERIIRSGGVRSGSNPFGNVDTVGSGFFEPVTGKMTKGAKTTYTTSNGSKSFTSVAGGMIVKYVAHHPGRTFDKNLRDAFMAIATQGKGLVFGDGSGLASSRKSLLDFMKEGVVPGSSSFQSKSPRARMNVENSAGDIVRWPNLSRDLTIVITAKLRSVEE